MKTTYVNKMFLLVFILMMSLSMLSCSSDSSDDDNDGLIYNQTANPVTVNFLNVKIVELTPGALLPEKSLEKDTTYLYQVTFFDNAGNVLEVQDHTIVIDGITGEREINGQSCSWFIRISGDVGNFRVIDAS